LKDDGMHYLIEFNKSALSVYMAQQYGTFPPAATEKGLQSPYSSQYAMLEKQFKLTV